MNIENPTSIISSATNAVAQITSLAAEKLGPITTKTVEVVSRQVIVEAVTVVLAAVIFGLICFATAKLAMRFNSKITGNSSHQEDEVNFALWLISTIVSVLSGLAFLVLLVCTIVDVPTAIFNTEYATAEKFVEIFQKIKP